jgi:hypothetical protein
MDHSRAYLGTEGVFQLQQNGLAQAQSHPTEICGVPSAVNAPALVAIRVGQEAARARPFLRKEPVESSLYSLSMITRQLRPLPFASYKASSANWMNPK